VQSAQAISATYDFDLAARDYMLADGAIESVVEAIPRSALVDPSQSRELIFCCQSDWLQGRRHISNAGKFRRDLQEHNRFAMSARVGHDSHSRVIFPVCLVPMIKTKPPRYETLTERSITAGDFGPKSIM